MTYAETTLKLIEEIAATSSRTQKEALLKTALGEPLFECIVKATYDPFITYGLVPEHLAGAGVADINQRFWGLVDALAKRELTGNAAKAEVEAVMSASNKATAEILWRILSKDLRAGFTDGSVNRVAPGTIRVFDVMLSHKYEPKRIKTFPVMVQPKLDGLRAICLVKDNEARFYSRTGKEFVALAHLGPHVVEWVNLITYQLAHLMEANSTAIKYLGWLGLGPITNGDPLNPCLAFEGEVLTGNFASTTGDVRRKSQQAEDARFYVFDVVPYDVMTDASQKAWKVPYRTRDHFLQHSAAHLPAGSPIRVLEGKFCNSHDDIQAAYEGYRDTKLGTFLGVAGLDNVLEGAIVKPLDAPYEKKRSYGWLKMKAEETEDLRVTDIFVGEGKYDNNLGGLIVDREGVKVRVGGGFSDALRGDIWTHKEPAIGRLIEVEYHEVTPDGSLRHPRFVRFRDDKDKEAA